MTIPQFGDDAKQYGGIIAAGLALAVVSEVFYSFQFAAKTGWPVFGTSLLVSAASLATGGLFGFLFGIPHSGSPGGSSPGRTPPGSESLGGPLAAQDAILNPSTNLEQISDWLTKILVGAGLTQVVRIPAGASSLFDSIAPALGGRSSSSAYAGAMIIFFSVVGFVTAWLGARVLLTPILAASDRRALALYKAAAAAEEKGDSQAAQSFRSAADSILHAATGGGAAAYEALRGQAASTTRMQQMDALVESAKTTAAAMHPSAELISEVYNKGTDGSRIMALGYIQAEPDPANLSLVIDAVTRSRSGTEQYHGLLAAEALLPVLDPAKREEVRIILATIRDTEWVRDDPYRRDLVERLLHQVEPPSPAATPEGDPPPASGNTP